MGENYCELFLEKLIYVPGETINGRVHCHFSCENTVRNIYLRFKGRAKVYWKRGKTNYSDEEIYFEMESPLLQGKTTFPPGDYDYPFNFGLKCNIPSSATGVHGDIKYTATAVVDNPFAFDFKSEKVFTICHSHSSEDCEPMQLTKEHIPTWNLFSKAPVRLTVTLPKSDYIVSEMVAFYAHLENFSRTNVKEVRFKLVQGFTYYANETDTMSDDWEGQEYAIIDSDVATNSQKSWDLELRIPIDAYGGNLSFCKIMKVFWELQAEVVLPFPNLNFKIKIPFKVSTPT